MILDFRINLPEVPEEKIRRQNIQTPHRKATAGLYACCK